MALMIPEDRPEPKPGAAWPMVAAVLTIAIGLSGLIYWAATADLASAALAPGRVMVETRRKAVQHLEGGIVAEILVKDGQLVEAGQVLVRMDPTRAAANLALHQTAWRAAKAREARLIAERDGVASIAFPEALLEERDQPEVAALLRGEQTVFDTRRAALEGQIAILRQKIGQLDKRIEGLAAQEKAKRQQMGLIADELGGLRELYSKGYTPRTRILALERGAASLSGDRGEHVADMAQATVAKGETQMQILQLELDHREEAARDLRQTQEEILKLQEQILAARDVLNRLEVRAPQAGRVVGLAVFTERAVIQPGSTLMEIVPGADRLVVQANVSPMDIEHIRPGLQAEVRFPALRQRVTPSVPGTVIQVSADAMVKSERDEPHYEALIMVTEQDAHKLGDALTLVPGMPAEVIIATGERTALNYIVGPITDVLTHAMRED